MTLTLFEFLQLANATGMFTVALAIFKWAMTIEKRMTAIETGCSIHHQKR